MSGTRHPISADDLKRQLQRLAEAVYGPRVTVKHGRGRQFFVIVAPEKGSNYGKVIYEVTVVEKRAGFKQ